MLNINLLTIGKNLSPWIEAGSKEYLKRLRSNFLLDIIELPLAERKKFRTREEILRDEAARILKIISSGSLMIALDEKGKQYSSIKLAERLQHWQENYREINLVIGGPDGLSSECLARANVIWSLSELTLPHPLVRIVVLEQLYRAHSILQNHPYHRE